MRLASMAKAPNSPPEWCVRAAWVSLNSDVVARGAIIGRKEHNGIISVAGSSKGCKDVSDGGVHLLHSGSSSSVALRKAGPLEETTQPKPPGTP